MELRIDPEPIGAERKAIEVAVRRSTAHGTLPGAYRSLWRRAGITDSLGAHAPVRPS